MERKKENNQIGEFLSPLVDFQKSARYGNLRYEQPKSPQENSDGSIDRHRLIGDMYVLKEGLEAKRKRII